MARFYTTFVIPFLALLLTLGTTAVVADDIQRYLAAHNSVRAQHGAKNLVWNATSAGKAQSWANRCQFQHSGGSLGPLGGTLPSLYFLDIYSTTNLHTIVIPAENLAAGFGGGYNIEKAIKSWTDEVCESILTICILDLHYPQTNI